MVRKRVSLLQKANPDFKLLTILILIIYGLKGEVVMCQENTFSRFSWLYNAEGKLIVNDDLEIDRTIVNDTSKNTNYSYYLNNRIILLNKINPTSDMIHTGEAPTLILRVYFRKKDFSSYIIDKVRLEDTTLNYQKAFLATLQEQLLGTVIYNISDENYFYIHLPIKFELKLVDLNSAVGITKSIKDGWLVISSVTNFINVN